ncbi:MAG: hypothetical protein ACREKE_10680, partial [bacterium]
PTEQSAWRTLGEVCLGEGLFEEACWIFRRLLSARPTYPIYSELLRQAESGLAAPPLPPSASSAPAFATQPVALPTAFRPAPRAPLAPDSRGRQGTTSSPLLPPWPGPSRRRGPVFSPVPRLATIQPTAYVLSFGDAPTFEIGPLDDSDELIE